MNNALPDGNVENYEIIIEGLELPDVNDRHVLAAAITAKADVIVTFNLKDFPTKYLEKYNLVALHPDDFIFNLINTDLQTAEYALMLLINNLRKPPQTKQEVLNTLENCGLVKCANYLRTDSF